jgi:hypothetical protein
MVNGFQALEGPMYFSRSTFLVCSLFLSSFAFVPFGHAQVKPLAGRIAVSLDGNAHDRDDIGSSAMMIAILSHAGFKKKIVHFGYNDHVWWNSSLAQKNDMTRSTLGTAKRFAVDADVFYDVIAHPFRAYRALAAEINKSTASNPLYILAGGPYQHICEGIKLSKFSQRKFVTVINHGDSNPTHGHGDNPCLAKEVKTLGIHYVDILNQNGVPGETNYGFKAYNYDQWVWLKNHPDSRLRWVYQQMKVAYPDKADVSDAGMAWYLVTGGPLNNGDQRGNPNDLKRFFAP